MTRSTLFNRTCLLVTVLILLIFSNPTGINAQYYPKTNQVKINLESLRAPANMWRIEDILNISIENTDAALYIYLVAEVSETKIGDIYTIESNKFDLPESENRFINPAVLEPIEVTIHNSTYSKLIEEVLLTTGSLPAGTYEICVDAFEAETEANVGHSCIYDLVIAFPSPPELIYPLNESIVIEDLPIFTWLPPMPLNSLQVNYTIEIVEILDGQTPLEAIESNYQWYINGEIENLTSHQYPVENREFIRGSKYAWRVEAIIGNNPEYNPVILSPVWSFVFEGMEQHESSEPYALELISPRNDTPITGLPFFEWQLINPSAQTADRTVKDGDIWFDLKIWKWPDTLDTGQADIFSRYLEANPQLEPDFPFYKLSSSYFNFAETDDTLPENHSYFWKVTCIKNEIIIAESEIQEFYLLSDYSFKDAAESMLNSIDLFDASVVYGIVDPIQPGTIIQSEEPTDIDTITVKQLSYLFIIDDEPYSRFGHPVRYALVDTETKSVNIYNANWFPTLKNSDDLWKSSGHTNFKGTDVEVLATRGGEETLVYRSRELTDDARDAILGDDCGKHALIIDGGDKDRTSESNTIASNSAKDADSIQAIYEKQKFHIYRFSQYWKYKDENTAAIPIDPEEKTGTAFLRKTLLQIKQHYIEKACCESSNLNFELFIYISTNALKGSSKFKIYKEDGSGKYENIDYFTDILRYLKSLPQCIKITLFIDACYAGILVDTQLLDKHLIRGNYEIITASDADKTTGSGLNRYIPNQQPEAGDPELAQEIKSGSNRNKQDEKSYERKSYSDQFASSQDCIGEDVQTEICECIAEVNKSVKDYSEKSNQTYPNPLFACVESREEFSMHFPVKKNQSAIRDCKVSPSNSATMNTDNLITDGDVILYSKVKGEIVVIVTYEDGSQETKSVVSKRGDDT